MLLAAQDKLELLSDIQKSLIQLEEGSGISHKAAKNEILMRIKRDGRRIRHSRGGGNPEHF